MRKRIFEIVLLVLDRYIERCCVPISFYYWQCWGTLVDLQYPVSCSLQASSGIFFRTYALASKKFRATKAATRPPTNHRERCAERWLCRRTKSCSELALSTSSLPGLSKNALDSVDSVGDCMAVYLDSDRHPAFANRLFMVGMSDLENLHGVLDVKNQRNKKSLAHINSGLGLGQIYGRCAIPRCSDNAEHDMPLAVTDCSEGIFETRLPFMVALQSVCNSGLTQDRHYHVASTWPMTCLVVFETRYSNSTALSAAWR